MERPKQEAPSKLKQVPDDLDTDKDSEKSENVPVSDGRDEHSTSSSGVTGDQTEAVQLSDSGSGEENIVSSEVVMATKDSNNPSTGIIKQTGSVSGHGNLQNIHSNGPLTINQTTTVMNNPVLNGNPLVTYCTAIQEENKFNVRKLHAELGLRLNDTITKTQLEKLLFFFCNIEVFERRDVEQMRNFMNVWQELEMRGKIRPREYGLLEEAFRSIQHTVCHIDVVQEYMEKIRSEDGVYEGWNMRKYEVIETHEKMEEYIVAYKPLMVQRICFGTVFQNAVFGVVSVEGGEIRLTNGSVRLQVPPKAIDTDVIFSAFCDPPEPQFSLKPGDEPNLVNGDNIVKYSLPVRLGPQNTQFNIPVMLTVTNHSLPNIEKGSKTKPLNVYRKEADTDAWACVGACFFDGDNYLTARISLNHFSSYVLGMPVSTTSLPPLNVHILIAALAPTEDNGNELKVFFMMNDFDYIGGFINQNCLAVDCRTCLYLDPRSDVTVTWIRRRQEEPSSVQFTKEGYLRQELIQNLGVKTTFLSIVQPQDDECACLEKESVANEVYEDVLLLKQNDEIIAELLFNEPQLMPTQQSDQPDSVSPHPQAPTITMETQIRELPALAISHLCQSIEPAVQMKILKDLGHIPQDMITPVDSVSTNTDVLKQKWHTLSDKMDTLVNALVNCGCVAAADYLCVEILKVPPVMPVPTLTKQKDFAAIEAVSDIKPDDETKKMKNSESVTKIGMDPESIKEDFSRLRNRMKKLGEIVRDALGHLDDIAEEYFGGNKSLLLPPEEEEFILSALELRQKPVALFIGQSNSGKSSLINELCQRSHLLPTSERACTARLVSLDYADDYGSESWQLIDEAGTPQGEPQRLVMPKMKMKRKRGDEKHLSKGRLPADMVTLEKLILSEKADEPKICDVSYTVEAHVNVDILKYGIQLFDTPGFGERKDLDDLICRLIVRDLPPLIVYVIDGYRTWQHTDSQILAEIKGLNQEATIMYVVNKIEPFPKRWMDLDRCSGSDEEILDTDRLSKYESLVMDKIKAGRFLGWEESFHTSEMFHCISAKQQATARRKGNLDPSDEYVARFKTFEACFLKKMYEQVEHLEGRVMNHAIALMEGLFTMFGKQQPVPICLQKMDEMHADFTRNIDRMKHLRDEGMNLGDQILKSLEKKVKPVLVLDLCEIYSVQYEIEHGRIELGQKIRRDGRYTIYECPDDDDLVVYVHKKDNCGTVEEWMKGAVEIFNAYDIGRQLGTVNKIGSVNLINCVGMWMPDRETFHVLFDKTDETVAEYVIREQSSLKQRLKLALEVGQGLQLLHRIQYVHLDLRPRNILMRGSQPKIDICRWQSLDNTKIQTDTTKDVDICTFGTLLWTMCEGTFGGSSPTFQHYDQLKQALESGVIPDTPGGRIFGEPQELQVKIYEQINHLCMQPELYSMEIVNDRLAALIASPGSMPFDPDQSSASPLGKGTIHLHSQSPAEVQVKANPPMPAVGSVESILHQPQKDSSGKETCLLHSQSPGEGHVQANAPMPAVGSAESISHQPRKDSSPPDLHLRAGLTRSEMTELQAAKDMDIPDEEDVCRLNLREVRSIMQTMGLSMKGITSLYQAQLRLKTEIIKRKSGRKNDKQKLAAIVKKVKEDHERKSNQLISFLDAIETKINSISVTEPLRKLFSIICGDYKNIFENQRKELKKRPHKLLVTGDLKAGKTSVTNNLLGETILPESFLYTAQAFSEISYGDQDHVIAYPWDGSEPLEITPEDGKEFSEVFKEKIDKNSGVFKRIEIYLNNEFLKKSEITVIDTPGLGAKAETTQMVLEHLQDAFGLLFVLNTENRGGVLDQICELAHEITRATTEHRQFFSIKSAVFLGNKWDAIQPEYHELLSKGIQEKLSLYWPGFRSEQFVAYSAKDTAALLKEGYMSRHYCELLNRFELLMSVDLDNKLRLNFSWIVSMLQKIIFGLDNFINRKMDLKNQKRTFVERITRLQEVTVKDFKALIKTLNKVGDELVARLKNFLLDESVLASLADWNVYEFRLVTNWEELKQQLYQCLTSRLDAQIRKWLMRNMEFQHTMETFQQKVVESVGIVGEELEEMMKLTSSQDEQKVGNSAKADKSWAHPYLLDSMTIVEHTHFGYLPDFSVSNVVSVSASIHPRGFTLPSMIRSYFRSRFEFEKYKGQPVEYLKKASEMLVKEYCNSKNGLHAQVVQMMEPCHEFIDWLTEVILEHMKKDKEMIRTFLSEESVDTQLKKEYPYRRAIFEAVLKSLRHFELFSLQRMSNHVALFSLNDVAFSENDEAKICGGFDADIYQAALKILPTATLVETDAVTKGGKKMMTANMTSIVEMKLLPSMKEEEFLSTTSGLGQSVQSSEKNWDGLGKGSTNCELSSCSEGYVSDIGAKVYAAFRDEIDCLEKRKDVEKVAEWLDGLFDEPCSKDIDEHSLEDENYDSNTKKACHYNRRPPIVISGKMGHVSIRCIKRPILEKDIYQYLEEERCYSCHRCPHLVKFKGTCISENRVYHKLEPLQCSLRNFMIEILWSKPSISSPSYIMPRDTKSSKVSIPDDDDSRYNIIKDWLMSVLEGLVYLHAQGLTSLDLSLDSIAVDVNNVVKLTSISCPKRIFNFEQLRSMNEDDLRSYRYIALEVFEQGPEKGRYTSKSDMYAFGLLIWEILCGKVAFEDDFSNKKCDLKTADRFMEFIRSRRPVVCTSELCVSESGFVSHLEEIQNKSWAYDPNQRITSELCMELVQKDPCHSPMPVMRP